VLTLPYSVVLQQKVRPLFFTGSHTTRTPKATASVVFLLVYWTFSTPHECSSVLVYTCCINRWNCGLWRQVLVISLRWLISFPGFFLYVLKIAIFSWVQRWHLGVPKVLTQVRGFSCQILVSLMQCLCNLLLGSWKFCRT